MSSVSGIRQTRREGKSAGLFPFCLSPWREQMNDDRIMGHDESRGHAAKVSDRTGLARRESPRPHRELFLFAGRSLQNPPGRSQIKRSA